MQIKTQISAHVNSAKKSSAHFLENVRLFLGSTIQNPFIFPDII